MSDLYSEEAQARRDKFNSIINRIDMVLMNNIPEVDPSIWENWQDKSPIDEGCYIVSNGTDDEPNYYCEQHKAGSDNDCECDEYEGDAEVYQWYAVNPSDAEYLARHNQYVTYSDMLDTYFLAVCHYGTSWDYVESMVTDILGEEAEA